MVRVRKRRLSVRDTASDPWPMRLQRQPSHEKPDMGARHGVLNDTVLRRSDMQRGIKNLFGCRAIVRGAGQQVGRTRDVA
jgi:hypothetical protein